MKTIFTFLLLTQMVLAQFSSRIEISSSYDDNIYRSPFPITDRLTDVDLYLNFQPENSNIKFFYNVNFFLYKDLDTQNFSMHSLGLNYFLPFGKDDLHVLYLGGDWTTRINREDYNYYDFNQLFMYTNVRFDLDFTYLKSGYNFRYRSYFNLPELSNMQHYLFVQFNKSLESRTTFILESDFGYKTYNSQETIYTNEGGRLGRGRDMSSYTYTTTTVEDGPSMGQIILLARIAQSIYERMGVYIQFRQQISLTDNPMYYSSEDYYYDEELFDDPFSYESRDYSSQLTWLLPWTLKLQIGGSFIQKNYITEQAYISIEDTSACGGNRYDEKVSYYVHLSKTFNINTSWLQSLQLNFYYSYMDNRSNSIWYDYKNAIYGAGIRWIF